MFGHQNDVITQDQKQDVNVTLPEDAVQALTGEPETTPPTDNQEPVQSTPAIDLDLPVNNDTVSPPVDPDFTAPANFGFTNTQKQFARVGSGTDSDQSNDSTKNDNAEDDNKGADQNEPIELGGTNEINELNELGDLSNISAPKTVDVSDTSDDTLLSIKADALHDLSPLVNQLDLEPEEKFKTIMMLIQTSDDKTLIPEAYEIAKKISDDKVKAQALLDVVNEINYFTHSEDSK